MISPVYQDLLLDDTHNTAVTYDRDEWYTPSYIIEAARRTLGIIMLDPASNPHANAVVKAERYYTKEDDAITKTWEDRVWCNPPYSRGNVDMFVQKMVSEHINGNMDTGIIIINNATETDWFQMLLQYSSCVCFLNSRVRFYHPERTGESPRQGQAVFFFGEDTDRFAKSFYKLGAIIKLQGMFSPVVPAKAKQDLMSIAV